ncbi:hypothetical protein L1F30_02250 [Simiduia sp. 21SJ11W-1]|uniref:L,D-transpeptidase family protein n=1 Tax=Simiduia sp. 21SJ11W-1 TaxID=2909669 RepID=UPI00209DA91C|nr:hypothetical protein [Simiduia sp. 21SJ11W-1]UTA48377.1 hypothetical protein L1F30_02250 [Simiduia sp. 21SJ11W-1]
MLSKSDALRNWAGPLLAVLALCFGTAQASVPANSGQLVLVISENWEDRNGQLSAWTRGPEGEWQQEEVATQVSLGRTGTAWGKGLHAPQEGVQKREGDGKAPAGIFALGDAFGALSALNTGLNYQPMSESHYCIDVPGSPLYNQTVDAKLVGKAAVEGSTEAMRRDIHSNDNLYSKGIFVAHNPENISGAGSCIFVHIWRGPDKPTAGCTAMPEAKIDALLAWLKREAAPVLVVLPQAEYERVQSLWDLPKR